MWRRIEIINSTRNENELLWSLAENVILVIYPIKFVFSCLPIWVGLIRVQIGSGLIRFGSFRVRVYIGSIRVQISSNSIRVIEDFGSIRFITVSGRFNFEFQVKIGSTLSHVGSSLVSGRSGRVVRFGSLLPGLCVCIYVCVYTHTYTYNMYMYVCVWVCVYI